MGCYRADRILGTAARAESGLASHGFTTFHLLPGGAVARPQVPTGSERRMWAAGSAWTLRADTLEVRLSTGLSGWVLLLEAHSDDRDTTFAGMARYITDVVVRDTSVWNTGALRIPVRVTRETCAAPG